MVVVMHDLNLAGRIADDAVLLSGGRVVAAGAADNVLTGLHIARAYGVEVEIGRTAAGHRYILPAARV
ncbi:hypothetical protein AB5I41_26895 [Sphingomonas sp. MMS24-JH45]